mgnify:CR=1 FL=1
MGTCLMSSFMLIHIQANKHYPSSPSLPSELNSFFLLEVFFLFLGLASKINKSMSFCILMVFVLLLNGIRCDGKHLHQK